MLPVLFLMIVVYVTSTTTLTLTPGIQSPTTTAGTPVTDSPSPTPTNRATTMAATSNTSADITTPTIQNTTTTEAITSTAFHSTAHSGPLTCNAFNQTYRAGEVISTGHDGDVCWGSYCSDTGTMVTFDSRNDSIDCHHIKSNRSPGKGCFIHGSYFPIGCVISRGHLYNWCWGARCEENGVIGHFDSKTDFTVDCNSDCRSNYTPPTSMPGISRPIAATDSVTIFTTPTARPELTPTGLFCSYNGKVYQVLDIMYVKDGMDCYCGDNGKPDCTPSILPTGVTTTVV
ncbi:hypothetical protein ScPMuIL_001274 [Solemya velum]